MLLVGTKSDLRGYKIDGVQEITEEDATALAHDIGSPSYVECSALTQEGLHIIFNLSLTESMIQQSDPDLPGCSGLPR